MKFFLFFLIVILVFQSFTEAISSLTNDQHAAALNSLNHHQVEVTRDQDSSLVKKIQPTKKINCNYACGKRCKLSSRKKVCSRACGSCCAKCQCVPAGTYGNHNACPCYARLRTHGNRLKCP